MKSTLKAAAATAVITFSMGAFAAKPTSITFESEGTAPDGRTYANYIVKCSDSRQQPLTAWDNRKNWCVGKDSQEDCFKKQIRAAKQACQ
jgi:hypothetical protein